MARRFATRCSLGSVYKVPGFAPPGTKHVFWLIILLRPLAVAVALRSPHKKIFTDEPLPIDSPLRSLGDKISMSAHMVASNLHSGLGPGYKWATQSVLEALSGRVPNNVFNPEAIEQWKERFGDRKALPSNKELKSHPGFGPVDP